MKKIFSVNVVFLDNESDKKNLKFFDSSEKVADYVIKNYKEMVLKYGDRWANDPTLKNLNDNVYANNKKLAFYVDYDEEDPFKLDVYIDVFGA